MTAGRTGTADVVVVRRDRAAPTGWTTVVRLLGLLPAHWACHAEVDQDRVVLRVELAGATDPPAVRRAVSRVLADTALRGWTEEARTTR
ncbi:hypothetical protein ACIQUZ_17350 [Streptomyces griseus]|uniref:Uncharacterized protein n=1 Tax=Streptomyces griseus subsp. griseus (strain JCM 4626 / CBS 651.72 / NBRC 13350 / KCC S-0626 / ISP 5235) TaxID=455632 RepID=B1VUM3_STRGG|nr:MULTISPECIES: hypothetical protein [Streptomyces]MYR52073.1 hypothetical protein [Streptomyces sp. SID4928]MYT81166.1 hypothetical protein [Streptomyces sp. SID8364]EGE44041.1 hypothetical protein SACT1_4719 [Streptomyces sp. ACT-1]MBW3706901.1 hypothetical protein [Streptomyces griseus]SBV08268.1 hypothetical protein YW3DRAFT_04270 [Streptomyces sp. MnatMP-M77]